MTRKVNMMTDIVQRAQAMYPGRLQAAVQYIGQPAYGKKIVDRRTSDAALVRMLPDQIAALAQTDPKTYMDSQERLSTLRQRAAGMPPLPAPGDYEGE